MSIRERAAWLSLVVTTIVWGLYFWRLWPDLRDGSLSSGTIGNFIGAVFVLVVAQVLIAIVLAVTGRKTDAPPDEREERIELKGARNGFGMINLLLVAVSTLWMIGASPLVMANGILAAMVVAEIVRSGSIIAGFRRGF